MSNNANSNQKVNDKNVSETNSTAGQPDKQAQPTDGSSSNSTVLKKQSPPKYQIINPTSGEMVQPSNPNYETYKAELVPKKAPICFLVMM
ncbi:MAG TPA: hypothetical protein VHO94_01565 [Oscillospiraceae bacterium]|nr:hypothetical protein [Oscillospiraceae bacterium]